MDKRKLLFVVEALGGGVRRHIVDLLENITKESYEIHVIYGDRTDQVFLERMKRFEREGIYFHKVESLSREIRLKDDFAAIKAIYQIMKKIKPDVVHCHSSKAGAIGRICANLLGIKQVYYTPHAYAFMNPSISPLKNRFYLYIEKALSFFMTKAIHVSRGEEQFALEYNVVTSEKSTVIYNGIQKVDSIKKNLMEKSSLVVGTVARMDAQKNPLEFVHIAEQVIASHPEITFVYVGDGEMFQEIKDYVDRSPYKQNIILTGFHPEPMEKLKSFDLFLTTSTYEGLPYSLIESISLGVPIVATDIIGNNEVVKDGFNGFLYKQGDIDAAASIIQELCENRERLESISRNSIEWYSKNFMLENMIHAYEGIYNAS